MNIPRRRFFSLLGCMAVASPLVARAQQNDRMRRIGVLMNLAAGDQIGATRIDAFVQALQNLNWTEGRNIRIDIRWTAGKSDQIRKSAAELIALGSEVVLAVGSPAVRAVQQASGVVSIVFANVTDPVGGGLIDSLARPGRSTTGFTQFEFGLAGKWLELLKQLAPMVTRAAVLRDSSNAAVIGLYAAIQTVAPSFGVELLPVDVSDPGEIERAIADFARGPNNALVITAATQATVHRALIITMAARHRLPAVYPWRYFVAEGGLISYGPNAIDPYRRAAGYVDRILKGEKPADLPVQAPTKYDLVINLKTAKALGLDVPAQLLARADEVIE